MGTGERRLSFPKRQQQYCMSFEFMQSASTFSSDSSRSLSKPPRRMSLNVQLAPFPLCTLAHKQTGVQSRLPHTLLPPLLAPASVTQKGDESVLIQQSEQPFHRAGVCNVPIPEWGIAHFTWLPRLQENHREALLQGVSGPRSGPWSGPRSGPRSGPSRRQIKAPRAAPIAAVWSLDLTHSHGCAHARH